MTFCVKTVVRLAMMFGLGTVSLSNTQKTELEVEETKMLRSSGCTGLDMIRSEGQLSSLEMKFSWRWWLCCRCSLQAGVVLSSYVGRSLVGGGGGVNESTWTCAAFITDFTK